MYSDWIEITNEAIDANITRTSPGNYRLGRIRKDNDIKVRYVGRSDSDLAARLKKHLGEGYKYFKFKYATSPKAAFEQECKDYHNYGELLILDNKIHPDSPSGIRRECPICRRIS